MRCSIKFTKEGWECLRKACAQTVRIEWPEKLQLVRTGQTVTVEWDGRDVTGVLYHVRKPYRDSERRIYFNGILNTSTNLVTTGTAASGYASIEFDDMISMEPELIAAYLAGEDIQGSGITAGMPPRERHGADSEVGLRKSSGPLWPGDWAHNKYAGKILQADLASEKIPYKDLKGVFADFHALRNTHITNLARHGVPLATALKLARHFTPVLTAKRYTH